MRESKHTTQSGPFSSVATSETYLHPKTSTNGVEQPIAAVSSKRQKTQQPTTITANPEKPNTRKQAAKQLTQTQDEETQVDENDADDDEAER